MINIDDATDLQTKVIEAAFQNFKTDKGAFYNKEVIAALSQVFADPDRAKWSRIRHRLKSLHIVSEVEKTVSIFYNKIKYKNTYTNSTLNAGKGFRGEDSALIQHQPSTEPSICYGGLLEFNEETGRDALVIESRAAKKIKTCLDGFLAYDARSQSWYEFVSSHWTLLASSQLPDRTLLNLLYTGAGELGFKPSYKAGIKALLADGDMLPLPQVDSSVLPFLNGLLDLHTRKLIPVMSSNAPTWCLPYAYSAEAGCPNIKAWLLKAVDGDEETLEFLRAWMAAVLHGRSDLQKFLHLKGSGGTGKGVFMRLLAALVGSQNSVSTNLKELETNRFEAASLVNKRLAVISESDKYGGSINVLKAITGQDEIRFERKHQQQSGSFVFQGLVVMASNESLQVTDHTSGLDRRRLTVIFDRRATVDEKKEWESGGGEASFLHGEIPGLVNWLLELSQENISRVIRTPPGRVSDADHDAMAATNPIADWINECCVASSGVWTQIGDCQKIMRQGQETTYEGSDALLYPSYLLWSQRAGKSPLSLRRFSELVIQTCVTLGIDVHKTRRGKGVGINGLSLKVECTSIEYARKKWG